MDNTADPSRECNVTYFQPLPRQDKQSTKAVGAVMRMTIPPNRVGIHHTG